jgi:hypothetical protein
MIHTRKLRGQNLLPDFTLVAKIALSVAAAACVGLLVLLFVLSKGEGSGYGHAIGAYDLAQRNLQPAILAFALAMIVLAGIITWLLTLYASLRVAGPLFRIARDLERTIERGPIEPASIRGTDRLQPEWAKFAASVAALRAHYVELGRALDEASARLQSDPSNNERLELVIARLKRVEGNARF